MLTRKKSIVLVVIVSGLVVGGAIFTGIYFGVIIPNQQFSVKINDIDPQDLGPRQWKNDFKFFYKMIEENYPFLAVKERMLGYNWLDLKEYYLERIEAVTSNEEFLAVMFDAAQALQNQHTHILNPNSFDYYKTVYSFVPLYSEIFTYDIEIANDYWNYYYNDLSDNRLYSSYKALPVYEKGNYVLRDGVGDWLTDFGNGSIILAVDGVPIDDAVAAYYERGYLYYDFIREKHYFPYLNSFHFGPDAVFTIQNTTGYISNKTIGATYGAYSDPFNYPSNPFYTDILVNNSIAYAHIQSFGRDIETDYTSLVDFYSQIIDYDYLIFDIRGNPGGGTWYWLNNIIYPLSNETYNWRQYFAYRTGNYVQHFRELNDYTISADLDYFDNLPPELFTKDFELYNESWMIPAQNGEYYFDGEIIILTDHMVYSASEQFTRFCNQTGFASIYGTHTGGDGIGTDPIFFVLPNSKLIIRMSQIMGIDWTGQANEEVHTPPDVLYESNRGNWTELIDFTCSQLV